MTIAAPLVATLTLVLLTSVPAASSSTDYREHDCAGGNYTVPSKYQQNIEGLSATLPDAVSSSPHFFDTKVVGSSTKTYALARCWVDTQASTCKRCLEQAFQDARAVCPFRKHVNMYYELCILAFAEEDILSRFRNNQGRNQVAFKADGPQVPAQFKVFKKAVRKLFNSLAMEAAYAPKKFATGQKDVNEDGRKYKLYGLADCSPKMSADNCHECLNELMVVPGLAREGEWRSALWCSYRFEPYPFFHIGKGHKTPWIVAVVVGVASAVIITLLFILILWCRLPERKLVQDLVKRTLMDFSDLKVTHGKMVLEVRPKADLNKGHAVNYLLEYLVNKNNWDSSQVLAIYIGDDTTDEDAFKVLCGQDSGFGILVSKNRRKTEAFYSLKNPHQMKEFLQKLVSWHNGEAQV